VLQIREELGPKTLKRHFQTDMSFGVEEVDMVRGFGRKEARSSSWEAAGQLRCSLGMSIAQ
jgi:hypothetical protein